MADGTTSGGMDDGPPRDFATLRALVAGRAAALPRRLNQVAAFAFDNPDDVAFGTAASVAERCGVQPSTLVRFAQAIGYQGFSDLQDVFRARLRERVPSYDERLALLRAHGQAASKAGVLLDGFAEAAGRSVAELRSRLDREALDRAVAVLASARTLYLVGLRRSFPITAYMAYAMGKLGIPHSLVDGIAGLGAEQAGIATPRDALLAVSFAPYASETVALSAAARARGVPVVSLTDSPFSPIVPLADVWLEVVEANFEGFRSLAATMSLAMALTVAIAGIREGEERLA